jgi:hypothetical protein
MFIAMLTHWTQAILTSTNRLSYLCWSDEVQITIAQRFLKADPSNQVLFTTWKQENHIS